MSNCNCKNPPGGQGECPPKSLAICRVIDGKCNISCKELPPNLSRTAIINWALSEIMEERREFEQETTSFERKILLSRNYSYLKDGNKVDVNFGPPEIFGKFKL